MQLATARRATTERGFTLLEVLVVFAFAVILFAGLAAVVEQSLSTARVSRERESLLADARFAMERISSALRETRWLLVPLRDSPDTPQNEAVREQRVPPEAGREDETAVLVVTLPASVDRDMDGVADADNDRDGRIDEDLPGDATYDGVSGVIFVDDDADGLVDEGGAFPGDDDERDGVTNEDPINGLDDDGDGDVDEDPPGDMNGDGAPGLAGIDDDGDSVVDEGDLRDDDEDGTYNEDWLDAVAFYLQGDTLVERIPVSWDQDGDSSVTGADFVELPIAERVTFFRVERIEAARATLVDVTLELTTPQAGTVRLSTRLRVGMGA